MNTFPIFKDELALDFNTISTPMLNRVVEGIKRWFSVFYSTVASCDARPSFSNKLGVLGVTGTSQVKVGDKHAYIRCHPGELMSKLNDYHDSFCDTNLWNYLVDNLCQTPDQVLINHCSMVQDEI